MIFRVPTHQVGQFWDHAKYAAVQTDYVSEEHMQVYCNYLLIDLLSGKKHILVMLSEERTVQMLMIVSFTVSKITGDKHLFLNNLYAWEKTTDEEKVDFFKQAIVFGRSRGCDYVEAVTANPKLQEIAPLFSPTSVQQRYLFKT